MPSSEALVEDASAFVEEKELIRFERADEYLSLLSTLVPSTVGSATSTAVTSQSDSQDEVLGNLVSILDEYQDQSNLLDPYLERIVSPPVEALQRHVRSRHLDRPEAQLSADALTHLSKLVYCYTKVRGYKTIVHYFPHEVADLPATLSFLEALKRDSDDGDSGCWELRYICLLWLSLICMIPFDLAKFDRSELVKYTTASRIAAVAEFFITSPGKERDAAAVVLGRLFQRSDVQLRDHFSAFLNSSVQTLNDKETSLFHATGILQALCEVVKTAQPAFVVKHLNAMQNILDAYDDPPNTALANDGLITKYKTKLTARLALKLLRPRSRRHATKFRILGATNPTPLPAVDEDEDESDVAEETEPIISSLISALEHKDTVVRYSAAKGLARICDRLPTSFLTQVIDAIISLFQINVPSCITDLSSVSEHTWQGACMALAELSRRGLLFGESLSEALPWILRALLFDVRRGAHSVGSNVRDAACYVVWALARSNDISSIRPHAIELAQRLVAVSTCDRDVSIRRAASAAFQECVGRLGLFPHGIDVIRMTDFYAVSVRRTALLECAINVARLDEYRGYLVDHLMEVVTVHWDPAMRKLGSQSLALVAMVDPMVLLPEITARLEQRLGTGDNAVLHGTLLTLAELSRLSRTLPNPAAAVGETVRASCFATLDAVRPKVFRSLGAAPLLQAACQLIGTAYPSSTTSSRDETQTWEKILNLSLARQEETVHSAAAEAIASLSRDVDISVMIRSTLDGWSSLTLPQQQSNALLLGAVDFRLHSTLFERVVEHLVALGRQSTKDERNAVYSENIEVRRNAADSITRAIVGLRSEFTRVCSEELLGKVVQSFLVGLEDYSMDQRGDVGSWVRLGCIAGLRDILVLCSQADIRVGEDDFHRAIDGLWKQAAERIDHVRHAAGTSVLTIYRAYLHIEPQPLGYDVVQTAFGADCLQGDEVGVFKNPTTAFRGVTQMLMIPEYRMPVLTGLVLSVGSKSDLGERIIAPALTSLSYPLPRLLSDLFSLAKSHFANNRLFIPSIHLVNLLLESAVPDPGLQPPLARLLKMVLSNAGRVKSIPRLLEGATLSASVVLAVGGDRGGEMVGLVGMAVGVFLGHEFPTVRARCAEQLYAVLSSIEVDEEKGKVWEELEGVLLDTKWISTTEDLSEAVGVVVRCLPRMLA